MAWRFNLPTRSEPCFGPAGLIALIAAFALSGPALGQTGEIHAAIVSPDVPVDNLSSEELRRLFLFSRRFWVPGHPATILFSEENLTDDSFMIERIYRMEYPSIRRLILEKLYQSEIDLAPKVVANDSMTVQFVASGSGLVAIVPIDHARRANVKVLTIDGKAPSDEGYPLRR